MVQPHNRVGIVLAGGKGTRLYPLTKVLNKHLLPIYNKPMIFYPIEFLINTGHQKIIIITNPEDKELFQNLLQDEFKVEFIFLTQPEPNGIPEAYILSKELIGESKTTLILGDNIFLLKTKIEITDKTNNQIFLKKVDNPQDYGVAKIVDNKIVEIIEKPQIPSFDMAITGLYCFDKYSLDYVSELKPSNRGELEITDLIRLLIKNKKEFSFIKFSKDDYWMDLGNIERLLECSNFLKSFQN